MFYLLSDDEKKKIEEISDITGTDYEVKGNLIETELLMNVIEDLLVEYHRKEEELQDLQRDIDDNYELKKVDLYERYGLSRNDFM